jgi:hypothetical protein
MAWVSIVNPVQSTFSGRSWSLLTLVAMKLTLRDMGDKSPKATQKQVAQKQAKADSAKQKKSNAAAAKQVPKTKK